MIVLYSKGLYIVHDDDSRNYLPFLLITSPIET